MRVDQLNPIGVYTVVVDLNGAYNAFRASEVTTLRGSAIIKNWKQFAGRIRPTLEVPSCLRDSGYAKLLCPDGYCLLVKAFNGTQSVVDDFENLVDFKTLTTALGKAATAFRMSINFEVPTQFVSKRRVSRH